jgi:hypothetical protein
MLHALQAWTHQKKKKKKKHFQTPLMISNFIMISWCDLEAIEMFLPSLGGSISIGCFGGGSCACKNNYDKLPIEVCFQLMVEML